MNDAPDAEVDETIAIPLAERHWIVMLAVLNDFIYSTVDPVLKELAKSGPNPMLNKQESAVLAGSLLARRVIVKKLGSHAVLSDGLSADIRVADLTAAPKTLRPARRASPVTSYAGV